MEIFNIFLNIIVPILILIGLGAFLHLKFQFDLHTLAKINIYYLVPGLIFIRLYETDLAWEMFFKVLVFFIFLSLLLYFVSKIISKFLGFSKGLSIAFSHSSLFYNSGNYGISVNDLAFRQDPIAMAVQVLVLTFQNLLVYSYGIISLQRLDKSKIKAAVPYFKMPVLYAMFFGLMLNAFDLTLPQFLYTPGSYIADALIALALLTLGAQVVQLNFTKNMLTVYLSVGVRLIISPLLAFIIIQFLNVDAITAQAMFIASAVPSSVNSAIIAQEYDNETAFAAQAVLASTIFSALSVTIVIFLSRILFV
ncbi:AEC family transporter [Planococcus sp. CPCC 101016]|uniref:AEC family transporter n=1 Tax=Planococcus sp. CPCC 101016 TaxID=2599617 RepID=UPI0011B7C3EE|nr:AEC family transporter [Planococcus sp. CPCC 101016]TWT06743.1 AEC family transporter [Planococcus sp. CPCC 101016]